MEQHIRDGPCEYVCRVVASALDGEQHSDRRLQRQRIWQFVAECISYTADELQPLLLYMRYLYHAGKGASMFIPKRDAIG